MINNPLVSIIVPLYNNEKYVIECFNSLLNQSYKNIEIIAINDGSTDHTHMFLKNFADKDSRITYIKKENTGVSPTRNLGLRYAQGEYITFVDGDDWVSLNFIEAALQYIQKYNLDFVLGGTKKVYGNKYQLCNIEDDILIYENKMGAFIKKVLSNGKIPLSKLNMCFTSGPVCKLFRKSALSGIEFDSHLVIGEDTVFNLEVLNYVNRVGVVPDIWYYYRINECSATQSFNPAIVEYTEQLLKKLIELGFDSLEYKAFLVERTIQQFQGMLLLYPLHKDSRMGIFKQSQFIKQCLKKNIWKYLLDKNYLSVLPGNKLDKLFMYLCINRMSISIVIFMKSKLLIKRILQKNK